MVQPTIGRGVEFLPNGIRRNGEDDLLAIDSLADPRLDGRVEGGMLSVGLHVEKGVQKFAEVGRERDSVHDNAVQVVQRFDIVGRVQVELVDRDSRNSKVRGRFLPHGNSLRAFLRVFRLLQERLKILNHGGS